MNLFYHLKELTIRFSYYLLTLLLFIIIGFHHKEALTTLLIWPISEDLDHFIYTHPLEATWTSLFNSSSLAFFITLPFLFYQISLYISPALYKYEKQKCTKKGLQYLFLLLTSSLVILFTLWPSLFHSIYSLQSSLLSMEPRIWSSSQLTVQLFLLLTINMCLPFLLSDLLPHLLPKLRGIYLIFVSLTLSFLCATDFDFFRLSLGHLLLYEVLLFKTLWRIHDLEYIGN
jgi:sec-independent protein translocase protein TatC